MKTDKEIKFGFVGMRTIKTVVAVYLALLYGSLLSHRTPVFAALAALICLQGDPKESIEAGKNRMLGTIGGGVFALLAILIMRYLGVQVDSQLENIIIALSLIPVIYLTLYLFNPKTVPLSAVVFLAITISNGNSDHSPFILASHRIIDTLVGVLISIGVNIVL